MPVVPEADPEEESDYRRTLRTTARNEDLYDSNKGLVGLAVDGSPDVHDVNPEDELML